MWVLEQIALCQPKACSKIRHLLAASSLGYAKGLEAEGNIVPGGHPGHQAGLLEHAAYPAKVALHDDFRGADQASDHLQ
ncbi:hypothetical protein D3C72_2426390 [compost metagenome]